MEPLAELTQNLRRDIDSPQARGSREKALAKGESTFREFKQRRLRHRLSHSLAASASPENACTPTSAASTPAGCKPPPTCTPNTGSSSCSASTLTHVSISTPVPMVFRTGALKRDSFLSTPEMPSPANHGPRNSLLKPRAPHPTPATWHGRNLNSRGARGPSPLSSRHETVHVPAIADITRLMEAQSLLTPEGGSSPHLTVGTPRTGATVMACPLFDPECTPPSSAYQSPVEANRPSPGTLLSCKSVEPLRRMTYTRCALFNESLATSPREAVPDDAVPDSSSPFPATACRASSNKALSSPGAAVQNDLVPPSIIGPAAGAASREVCHETVESACCRSQPLPSDARTASPLLVAGDAFAGSATSALPIEAQVPCGSCSPLAAWRQKQETVEDQDVKGSAVGTFADPEVGKPGQTRSECEKEAKNGEAGKRLETADHTSTHGTAASSERGPQKMPDPSANGEKDKAGAAPLPADGFAENASTEPKVSLCSSIITPGTTEPTLPSHSDFMAMAFDEGNMSCVNVDGTCLLPSTSRLEPTRALETGSAEMTEKGEREHASCTSEWVAMDCEGGPALSLLFENQTMKAEREELKLELRTISERLAAIEERTKCWPKKALSGKGRSASLPRLQHNKRPGSSSASTAPSLSSSRASGQSLASLEPSASPQGPEAMDTLPGSETSSPHDPTPDQKDLRRGRSRSRSTQGDRVGAGLRAASAGPRPLVTLDSRLAQPGRLLGQGSGPLLRRPHMDAAGGPPAWKRAGTRTEASLERAPVRVQRLPGSVPPVAAVGPGRASHAAGTSALARAQALLEQIGNVGDHSRWTASLPPRVPVAAANAVRLGDVAKAGALPTKATPGGTPPSSKPRSRQRCDDENIDPARQAFISKPAPPPATISSGTRSSRSSPAAPSSSSGAAPSSHPAHATSLRPTRLSEKQKSSAPSASVGLLQPLYRSQHRLSAAPQPAIPTIPKIHWQPLPSSEAQEMNDSKPTETAEHLRSTGNMPVQGAEAGYESKGRGSGELGQMDGTAKDGSGPDGTICTPSSSELPQIGPEVARGIPAATCSVDKTSVVQWWLSVSASPRDSALP